MKRIISLFLLLVITLTSVILSGCSAKSELRDDVEFLMLQPFYVGDVVTDTQHTFKKEDFKLLAVYTENVTEEVHDFTFEIVDLKEALYTIRFEWNGYEEEYFVPLKMDIYE